MTPTPADVAAAAWQAWKADLCVVPPREDGSKAPSTDWKQYQTTLPEITRITQWYGNNGGGQGNSQRHGIGLVCGQVSGGLEMLELEGAAVTANLEKRFREICDDAGLKEVLDRIVNGCVIQSPSGGYHMLYRVPTPKGNTKLARRVDKDTGEIQVLVETRGEGGYVVTAPSHGPVHPTGLPWVFSKGDFTSIASITDEERDALWSCARVLDDMPPPRPTTAPQAPSDTPRPGDVYNDAPDVHTATLALLTGHGWTVVGTRGDNTLLRRPGKDIGISATLRDDGTFYCFTTSTAFDAPGGHSPFHVKAVLEHGGDHSTAAKALTPPRDPIKPATAFHAPPDTSLLLPDDFWEARPELGHIRQAAHSATESADGVLHSILARIAAHTPHHYKLPRTTGGTVGLSYLTGLVGPPGEGKSGAWKIAKEVLEIVEAPPTRDDIPIGSGEGLTELLYGTITDNGEKMRGQKYHNACIFIDEGQTLTELAGRTGSTLLTTMRSIFTDSAIGQANAKEENKRIVPAGSYAYGIVAGFQPGKCGPLFADVGGGTPQRLTWAYILDSRIQPGEAWPGTLPWAPPKYQGQLTPHAGYVPPDPTTTRLDIATSIRDEVVAHRLARKRGEITVDPLDAHRNLVRLKVAALLAILDGRMNIGLEDWQLAGTVLDTSAAVRTWILDVVNAEAIEAVQRAARRQAHRQNTVDSRTEDHLITSTAEKIRGRQDTDPELTPGKVRSRMRQNRRDVFGAALEHAVGQGWVSAEWAAGWDDES